MQQYHKDHPFRPVDFRWERARLLREAGKRFGALKKEDDWVKLAFKFQKDFGKCKDDFDRYRLMEREPDIYFAYTIRSMDEKKQPMMQEIEARILADEAFDKIADRCGCSPLTIEIYENLFFHVTDRLKNTSYILHQVMGPTIYKGFGEKDYNLLWKLYGYFCGSKVLDALTTTFINPTKPENAEQVNALFVDDTKQVMKMKAAIAARTVGVNQFTQLSILEMYTKFLEIEKELGEGGGHDLILENIKEAMTLLPWSTGSKAEQVTNVFVSHYDNQAAELRSDEIMQISAGQETEAHKQNVAIAFPPEPEKNVTKT
jgi:hypothetical protein